MDAQQYVAVVPVKPPAVGKSRLGLTDDRRRDLAAAFALDTVAACLATPSVAEVLAVTDDATFARDLTAIGCAVLPDGPSGDLNTSLVLAAAEARRRWPDLRAAAVCADLPALRPADLEEALALAAPHESAFVADAAGVGTTMFTATAEAFLPRFGPGSRGVHVAQGSVELPGELASLRQDVDDLVDLARAAALGLGPHTALLEMPLEMP